MISPNHQQDPLMAGLSPR